MTRSVSAIDVDRRIRSGRSGVLVTGRRSRTRAASRTRHPAHR